jgi:hypothetical protein
MAQPTLPFTLEFSSQWSAGLTHYHVSNISKAGDIPTMTTLMIMISCFHKVFKTPAIESLAFEFVAEGSIPLKMSLDNAY